MKIETLVVIGISVAAIYRLLRWIKGGKLAPNPWNQVIEEQINQPDALPVCHRCFATQEHDKWFCPGCGASVGPYNNYLPYISIFSQGEVLRAGTNDRLRPNILTVVGYLFISLSAYVIFAPVYWCFLVRNFRQRTATESLDAPNLGELNT